MAENAPVVKPPLICVAQRLCEKLGIPPSFYVGHSSSLKDACVWGCRLALQQLLDHPPNRGQNRGGSNAWPRLALYYLDKWTSVRLVASNFTLPQSDDPKFYKTSLAVFVARALLYALNFDGCQVNQDLDVPVCLDNASDDVYLAPPLYAVRPTKSVVGIDKWTFNFMMRPLFFGNSNELLTRWHEMPDDYITVLDDVAPPLYFGAARDLYLHHIFTARQATSTYLADVERAAAVAQLPRGDPNPPPPYWGSTPVHDAHGAQLQPRPPPPRPPPRAVPQQVRPGVLARGLVAHPILLYFHMYTTADFIFSAAPNDASRNGEAAHEREAALKADREREAEQEREVPPHDAGHVPVQPALTKAKQRNKKQERLQLAKRNALNIEGIPPHQQMSGAALQEAPQQLAELGEIIRRRLPQKELEALTLLGQATPTVRRPSTPNTINSVYDGKHDLQMETGS